MIGFIHPILDQLFFDFRVIFQGDRLDSVAILVDRFVWQLRFARPASQFRGSPRKVGIIEGIAAIHHGQFDGSPLNIGARSFA
jgi:hypothetical protein